MGKMAARRKAVTLMVRMAGKVCRKPHVSMAAMAVMAVMAVTRLMETQMAETVRPELMELMDE